MANAMPFHMVKTALYPIIIQFDEETKIRIYETYTTKVFTHIRLAFFLRDIKTNSTCQDQAPRTAKSDQVLYYLLIGCSIKS